MKLLMFALFGKVCSRGIHIFKLNVGCAQDVSGKGLMIEPLNELQAPSVLIN